MNNNNNNNNNNQEPHSSEIIRGSVDLFGPLTEGIQIKSAITIPLMSYNGMYLDVETVSLIYLPIETFLNNKNIRNINFDYYIYSYL